MAQFYQSIKGAAALGTPVGTIIPFSATSTPAGFLLCDGAAVSRTTYAALFAVVGTTYGAGNGSSTFNVPDLAGKVPIGRDGSTYNEGATGGSASATPTLTDNITVTDNIAVNKSGTAAKSGSASLSGTVSASITGNPTKTGTAAKSGSASLSGAPSAGNLAVSVTGNVGIGNTTISMSTMPSHSHTLNAYPSGNEGNVSPSANNLNYRSGVAQTNSLQANKIQNTGGGGAHNHSGSHNLSGSMTGAPGTGNLAVSDNITVSDNIAVTKGNLATSLTNNQSVSDNITVTDNIAVSKSGTVSKSGNVTSGSISTVQPYTAVRYAIKF